MGGLESINSPVPQTLDPVLKLLALLGVDLPRQLRLVVILQHAGVVFGYVRGSCRVNDIFIVFAAVVASIDVEGSLALRHLEAVMHVDGVGKRRGSNAVHEDQGVCKDGRFRCGQRGGERGRERGTRRSILCAAATRHNTTRKL